MHSSKICLFCNNKYHEVKLHNQLLPISSCVGKCSLCDATSTVESMETVYVICQLCQGKGSRSWVDLMIRPYNKIRMERNLYNIVVGTDEGFREKHDLD